MRIVTFCKRQFYELSYFAFNYSYLLQNVFQNIYKRAAENEKYLKFIGKFKRNGNGYNGGYQNNYGNYQNNYGGGYTGSRANTQDRKTTNILNVLLVLRKSEYQEDMAKLKFAVQSAALNLLEEARGFPFARQSAEFYICLLGSFPKEFYVWIRCY